MLPRTRDAREESAGQNEHLQFGLLQRLGTTESDSSNNSRRGVVVRCVCVRAERKLFVRLGAAIWSPAPFRCLTRLSRLQPASSSAAAAPRCSALRRHRREVDRHF
ncbi:Protein of unknown function [Gryllus bimaculatus]|nr:Protein of unknown function [Gryllus bimaculatus]